MAKRILLIVVVMLLLVGLVSYSQFRPKPLKVSGFIEADEMRLGSRVGGRVAKVHVGEGDRVKQGQFLVELEPFDLLEREKEAMANMAARQSEYERLAAGHRDEEKAQAKARYDQLSANVDRLEKGPRPQEIEAARGQLLVVQAHLKQAESSHKRTSEIFKKGVATREEMDRASEELQEAKAMVIVREQELALLEAGTREEEKAEARAQLEEARQAWELAKKGFRSEEIDAAQAARDAAHALVNCILEQKEELKITAPMDGIVEALELQKGDLVSAGAPTLSMIDDRRLWVRAYIPQEYLYLRLGDQLDVTIDSFPSERFVGVLSFISHQAEFTASNVQTPEERSKQVFRIKVTLTEGLDRLRPGMAADVWLKKQSDGS